MTPSTRQLIDASLEIIGQEGLSGVRVNGATLHEGLSKLSIPVVSSDDQISRIAHELRRQKLIDISAEATSLKIQLSVKGLYRLQKSFIDQLTIPTEKPWDGRWYIVLYDIPARHSQSRYLLTAQLKRLGFMMVQGSTWVYPYPFAEVIQKVVTYTNLQPFVSYCTATDFDPNTSRKLKRHFAELISD